MSRRYQIKIEGKTYDVEVGDTRSSPVKVVVDGTEYEIEIPDADTARMPSTRPETGSTLSSPRPVAAPRPAPAAIADGGNAIRAPMPGRIVNINVGVGDDVKMGQAVVVLESMKMENTITAPQDGTVQAVHIEMNQSVQHGQTLVELD